MPISVAIVGSGPAGFYTAEAILKAIEDVEIDIIDRLPTPYGLIRDGVAPDHQTTKKVAQTYAKTATNDKVRFLGNIHIGSDISLDELRKMYDAVILAVGAPTDRKLGIPGEDKIGVYGSAAFVGWYNAHPDFRNLDPDLSAKAVAVVGVGNVAIDIARVLVKTRKEMLTSDLPDYAADAIEAGSIEDVYMFGRRGPVEAKFTNVELREMGNLEICRSIVDLAVLPDGVDPEMDMSDRDRRLKERNLATLKSFAERDKAGDSRRVHFAFYASPVEILGGDRVEGLRLERTRLDAGRAVGTSEFFDVPCGMVLPAIGYMSKPIEGAPFDARQGIVPNDDGRVEPGLYAVGWIKRGPTGVIASNRPDGVAVAGHIEQDIPQPGDKPGRAGLLDCLTERGLRPVDFAEWEQIDAAEKAAATAPAPRRKFTTIEDMLALLEAGARAGTVIG